MSYDLFFWRQDDNVTDTPQVVVERLSAGLVPGVSTLDLAALQAGVLAALPKLVVEAHSPTQIALRREAGGAFDLGWASQWVSVSSYGDVSGNDWNAIIDVMNAAGLATYDPQTGERFQQPDPTDNSLGAD